MSSRGSQDVGGRDNWILKGGARPQGIGDEVMLRRSHTEAASGRLRSCEASRGLDQPTWFPDSSLFSVPMLIFAQAVTKFDGNVSARCILSCSEEKTMVRQQ